MTEYDDVLVLSSPAMSSSQIILKNHTLHTSFQLFVFLGLVLCLPVSVTGMILTGDTVWEGEFLVEENILVPEGVTLTVRGNTVVSVLPAESTKTDPEYMTSQTEIVIRGNLRVMGEPSSPVVFRLQPGAEGESDSWSGIIVDGGTAVLNSCTVSGAETGVWITGGRMDLAGSVLTKNRYGLVAQGTASRVTVKDSLVSENVYGFMAFDGAEIGQENIRFERNEKMDFLARPESVFDAPLEEYTVAPESAPREVADDVLQGDTVWEGHIVVNGRPRVPIDSRLVILPGTLVEFRKMDGNGDGIGENGLMLQGVLIAKGAPGKPIVFRSAEKERRKGDWDAVNIINSDGVRNIIEYVQFEDAYRGLHFHFSNVAVRHCIFRNNYRGVQFQESDIGLHANLFYNNTSGVQARDSEIAFEENRVLGNVFGANFLRSHLAIRGNRFGGNLDFGLKVREGYPTVSGNIFHHNRFGLMFSDTAYGSVSANLMLGNGEAGMSVRTGSNMEITGNFVQGNGLSGISLRDSSAVVRANHISENGERGIGLISFVGPITENTIVDNRLYAIAAEDGADVDAPANWYGQDDIGPLLFDRNDSPDRGVIHYEPAADRPFEFEWTLAENPLDINWSGRIRVPGTVVVPKGVTLGISPGTTMLFGRDASLVIYGRVLAAGLKNRRITFTSAGEKARNAWGEVWLQYSEGSRFANCDFEYATWAIHNHFSPLTVLGCTFRNNGGGIRFRSGPLLAGNSLFSDNGIGIRAFQGTAEIINNSITRNDKGIFVREQGGSVLIKNNNIFANLDYNIWVGDFNAEDIPAQENWWGVDDPVETFFDARVEPGIGFVLFEPQLAQPLDISFEAP